MNLKKGLKLFSTQPAILRALRCAGNAARVSDYIFCLVLLHENENTLRTSEISFLKLRRII